jgi:Leu/Phe-tRNA-protein transferase
MRGVLRRQSESGKEGEFRWEGNWAPDAQSFALELAHPFGFRMDFGPSSSPASSPSSESDFSRFCGAATFSGEFVLDELAAAEGDRSVCEEFSLVFDCGSVIGKGANRVGEFTCAGTVMTAKQAGSAEAQCRLNLRRVYLSETGSGDSTQDSTNVKAAYDKNARDRFCDLLSPACVPNESPADSRVPHPAEARAVVDQSASPELRAKRAEAVRVLQTAVAEFRGLRYVERGFSVAEEDVSASTAELTADTIVWSFDFSCALFSQLAFEGYFPMSDDPANLVFVLIGKLSAERCVLDFDRLHVSKHVTRLAKNFDLLVNHSLEDVLSGIARQHKEENWLAGPYCEILRRLWTRAEGPRDPSFAAHVWCFELYDRASQELVAGEVGYVVGTVYTSLTGFRLSGTRHCGSIQMVATGQLLRQLGFSFWDLDEPLPYKRDLGAVAIPRNEFLERFRSCRQARRPNSPPESPNSAGALLGMPKVHHQAESSGMSKRQQKRLARQKRKKSGSDRSTVVAKRQKSDAIG